MNLAEIGYTKIITMVVKIKDEVVKQKLLNHLARGMVGSDDMSAKYLAAANIFETNYFNDLIDLTDPDLGREEANVINQIVTHKLYSVATRIFID